MHNGNACRFRLRDGSCDELQRVGKSSLLRETLNDTNRWLPPLCHGSVVYLTLAVLVAALGGLLFGYDTAVIAGAIGFLAVHFKLDPAMVGWATSSALAGCLIGPPLAGPVSDRFGRRNALIVAAVFFFISAVGTGLPRHVYRVRVLSLAGRPGRRHGVADQSDVHRRNFAGAIRGRMVSSTSSRS